MNGVTARIPWNGLLEYFGIPVANLQLPAATACPLCPKGGLRVYLDSFIGGAWYVCDACRFCGNSLDLAAKKLNTTPDGALAILIVNHVIEAGDADPKRMAAYANDYKDRAKLQEIWKSGQAALDSDLDRYLLELSVAPLQDAAWKNLAKRWLRTLSVKDLRKTWPGRGLRVVPAPVVEAAISVFEDMPGRPAAAVLRAGGEVWEVESRVANETSLIMGLSAVTHSESVLYACPNVEAVLKAQFRTLRETRQSAPLVAVRISARPSPVWSQLGRPLVFVAEQLTPDLVREAWQADGRVWICGSLAKGLDIRHAKPAGLVSAVSEFLTKLNPAKAVQFLRDTKLDSSAVAEFVGACSKEARDRLLPLLCEDPTQVQYGRYQIRLEGSCLYVGAGTGTPISDTAVKITHLYESKQGLCRGEILFGKRKIPFKAKLSVIEESPESWLRKQLWARGLGVPFVEKKWREHLVNIGYLLGNPKTIRKLPKMGWSQESGGLVLSSYCLKRGGGVQYYPDTSRGLKFGDTPTPVPVSSAAVTTLDSLPGRPVLWGVAAYTAATLFSRLSGVVPPALWFCGDAARYYGSRFAKALGCPHMAARTAPDIPAMQKRVDSARRHSWPVSLLVRADALRPPGLGFLGTHGMLITVDHTLKPWELAAATESWLIQHEGPQVEMAHAKDFVSDLLPAYLKDLASREFSLPSHPRGLVMAIYEDMADWWVGLGGSNWLRDDVLYAPRDSATPCLRRFLRLVAQEVQTVPVGFYCPAAAGTMCLETDLKIAVVSPVELAARLAARRIAIDPAVLTDRLAAAGTLQRQTPDGRWVIPVSLWNSAVVLSTTSRSA